MRPVLCVRGLGGTAAGKGVQVKEPENLTHASPRPATARAVRLLSAESARTGGSPARAGKGARPKPARGQDTIYLQSGYMGEKSKIVNKDTVKASGGFVTLTQPLGEAPGRLADPADATSGCSAGHPGQRERGARSCCFPVRA